MNDFQKLAFLHAMAQRFRALEAEARVSCDAALLDGYDEETGGGDRVNIAFGGSKVGALTITMTGGGFRITDRAAFLDWARSAGAAFDVLEIETLRLSPEARALIEATAEAAGVEIVIHSEVAENWEEWLTVAPGGVVVDFNGEQVEGVEVEPKRVGGTRLTKCGYKDVAAAVTAEQARAMLAEATGLSLPALEGGADE